MGLDIKKRGESGPGKRGDIFSCDTRWEERVGAEFWGRDRDGAGSLCVFATWESVIFRLTSRVILGYIPK